MLDTDERLIEIYDCIDSYKVTHGYSPNQDEIAEALHMTKAHVVQAMEMMEAEGMIVQPRGLRQAIKLLSRQPNGNSLNTDNSSRMMSG